MGKNIKQLTNVTPLLTALVHIVQNDTSYNASLDQIKTLFGIETEEWQTKSINNGTTGYISFGSGSTYGAVEIEYLAKRSGQGYISGRLTLLVDDSKASGVNVINVVANRSDYSELGFTANTGKLSSGIIQLELKADTSDANPVIFNYKITSKRPITV